MIRKNEIIKSNTPIVKKSHAEKSLLIISPHFLAFVHDQTIAIASDFSKIYVIVIHPIILSLNPFKKQIENKLANKTRIDITDIPLNVYHLERSYFTLPGKLFQNMRGTLGYRAVKKIIKKNKIQFDLIHAHFLWPAGYIGSKLKQETGVPLIITGHGYDVYSLPFRSKMWCARINKLLDASNAIITVSQKNKGSLSRISRKKINVLPNGYDNKKFKQMYKVDKAKLGLPKHKKIILSVGNLEPIKGYEFLIKAIEKMIKTRNNIFCVIVGGGSKYRVLNKMIKEKSLEKFVKLVGAKPHDEIPLWMNSCNIFVLPSLSEGNPTVMFEALGCGKPFVGTKVGGIPEIIINEKLGILVEPKDIDGLASAILKGIDKEWDKDYILKYAEQFTWGKIAEKIMGVYDEVLKK